MALDFTTASLDSRVTFTRSGNTATVVNSSGFIAPINADLPRFDHDPTTLVCKGLLIEEARTNIALDSNNFSAATWTKAAVTVTPNAAVSPDGTSNASLLTATTADGALFQTMAATTATVYIYSIYLRADTTTSIRLFVDTSGLNTFLSTLISVTTSWQRFTFSFTTTGVACKIYVGGGSSFSTPEAVYVYGAQLEVGAFATSYIPTTASQVTRTADVAVMTGTNFSNWYNASEGAFVASAVIARQSSIGATAIFSANDNTSANLFNCFYRASGGLAANIFSASVSQLDQTPLGVTVANTIVNIGIAYKINDSVSYSNGTVQATDTSVTVPTVTQLQIGFTPVGNYLNGFVRNLRFYKQRILNAEGQAFSK
jgi:hypothetical protein